MRLYAKLMFQPCQFKVKATVEGGVGYSCPSDCLLVVNRNISQNQSRMVFSVDADVL